MVLRVETSPDLRLALAAHVPSEAPPPGVACPMAITRSEAMGLRIAAATGASLENLETFSVARAAKAAGVPFGAVLGIANRVAPIGHEQWLRHHREASRAACDLVARFLELTPAAA
jgi:nucleoside phosphorylase